MALTPRALLLLPVIGLSTTVRAEGERALSVGAGWATFSTPGTKTGNMEPPAVTPDIGGSLSIVYEYALGSDFSLRGELVGGTFYGGASAKQSNVSYAGLGDAGVVFRFDVLKWVPYAFAGIGGIVSGGGPIDHGLDAAVVLGGGVDWLTSRDRSWGAELRLASFAGDVTLFTISARTTIRWGFF